MKSRSIAKNKPGKDKGPQSSQQNQKKKDLKQTTNTSKFREANGKKKSEKLRHHQSSFNNEKTFNWGKLSTPATIQMMTSRKKKKAV